MGSFSSPHFVIFPFLSQGHTIPLLHLSRLLRRRSVVVTLFTTAGNSPRIRASLRDTDVSIIEIPFPQNIDGVPPGVENTDKLSVESSFLPFARATEQMRESFEEALETLQPPVSCVVSDSFLWWTAKSAQKIGVPRLGFFGTGNFSATMYQILGRFRPHAGVDSVDEPFPMTDFPEVKLTRNDFEPPFGDINPSGPFVDFMMENGFISMGMSDGLIVNSFYEMESRYVDYWNKNLGPKAWNIGPLCLAAKPLPESKSTGYLQWLDEKWEKKEPVLYVSFGTQAEISPEQFLEIAQGLEKSEVSFLWALKSKDLDFLEPEFESRVKGRGLVAKEWMDQLKILQHEGVKGFLSHCGWNSVIESISAGVPILAMPFMAEQHMNARFVAEEVGVGLRIMPRGGTVRGHVAAEEVEMKVRELMGGGKVAEEVSKTAAAWGGAAHAAMQEGGSSWRSLDLLIDGMMGKFTD